MRVEQKLVVIDERTIINYHYRANC